MEKGDLFETIILRVLLGIAISMFAIGLILIIL